VTLAELPDGTVIYSFYDYERSTPLVALVILFIVCVLLLGRWRGLGGIGGLAASLVVLISFMLPSLLDGNSPVAVALVSASAIAFIALYLAHGFNAATNVALLSTFASLLITGILAWIFIRAANVTGFTDESTFFLDALGVSVDARGILLAGIRHRIAGGARRRDRDPDLGGGSASPSATGRLGCRAVSVGVDDRA
jgi:uncharacterized membrane protein